MVPEQAGMEVFREMVGTLEAAGISYWVARGVLRHFTLRQEFGDKQGDIEFHVLREDEDKVWELVDVLATKGYRAVDWKGDQTGDYYKIPLLKGNVPVELVFLDVSGDKLYHRAGGAGQTRFHCERGVFGDRRREMFGVSVRVPEDQYLSQVYGDKWREEKKAGGEACP